MPERLDESLFESPLPDTAPRRRGPVVATVMVIPYEDFSMRPERAKRQFARTPYAVSFRTGNGNSFILASVHVNFTDTVLRGFEIREIAEWVDEWVREPHVWDTDILVLGDFNADRVDNPAYGPFAQLLNVPAEMMGFPRTVYQEGKDKHYDLITWPVALGGDADGPSDELVYTHTAGYFDFQPHSSGRCRTRRSVGECQTTTRCGWYSTAPNQWPGGPKRGRCG